METGEGWRMLELSQVAHFKQPLIEQLLAKKVDGCVGNGKIVNDYILRI